MITDEKLRKMYDGIITNTDLTIKTKKLNEYGFNSRDISKLVENKTLERIKRGHYSFLEINELFFYGKELNAKNKYIDAITCFQKCYELDPTHQGVCFRLFLRSIKNKNYDQAFEYFDKIYNTKNEFYRADHNCYIYILSWITPLPEKYREYAKLLTFKDVKVSISDKRYDDKELQNKMRRALLNQRFKFAMKLLNDYIHNIGKRRVQEVIIKILLSQAIEKQNTSQKYMEDLIKNHQYENVIEYLENIAEHRNLSKQEKGILKLTKELSQMIKTGIIPKIQVFHTTKVLEAVEGKNYELALILLLKYKKETNIEPNEILYTLLKEIQSIKTSKNNVSIEEEQQKNSPKQKKEEAILRDQLNKAKINLEILSQSTAISESCNNKRQFEPLQDKYEEDSPNSDQKKKSKKKESRILTEKIQPSRGIEKTKKKTYDDDFIKSKLPLLRETGIVLLKPMSKERRNEIHEIVNNRSDIASFEIGSDNKRQIVLRLNSKDKSVNLKELVNIGRQAYYDADYDTCIATYRKTIELENPKAFVYSRLGLAYMKRKYNKKIAIDYLTVATNLAKEEQLDLDYTELIACLKGASTEDDRKIRVNMSVSDFENDINDYYGIGNIEQIAEQISSGMTLESACENFGIDEEGKNIISLIFAKECYAYKNETRGNEYLKKVEKAKNKSKFIMSLLKEVREKKRFYQYQVEEGQKRLLTPKLK